MADTYELIIRVPTTNSEKESGEGERKEAKATGKVKEQGNNPIKTVAKAWEATAFFRGVVDTGLSLMSVKTGNDRQQAKAQAISGIAQSAVSAGIAFMIDPIAGALNLAGQGIAMIAEVEKNKVARTVERLEIGESVLRAGPSFNRSRALGDF